MTRLRRVLAALFLVGMVAAIAAVSATYVYFRQIEDEVERAFATYRWAVPSRVYSDRQPLFVGLDLKRQGILERLERTGYRRTERLEHPGEYVLGKGILEIFQRPLEHPALGHPARRLRITLTGDRIVRIEADDSPEPQAVVFLEPETLAVLVGDTWQNRELVGIAGMPTAMTQAVVAIEDRRFFRHGGIDPQGIARAIVKDLLHMRLAEGGSTLTQQVVKNVILKDPARKFSRKYKELVMAYVIDREYGKDEILVKYLNEIYFGQDGPYEVRGIGAAARFFFGKPVDELSVPECAALAGVIHGPNRYVRAGSVDVKALTARRNQVLEAMYQVGFVTESELRRYAIEPPALRSLRQPRRLAPYFIDLLQRRLQREYSTDGLTHEGLSIYTTLQVRLQEVAEAAVTKHLALLEQKYARLRRSDPSEQLQAALVLLRPATGEIVALVGGRDYKSTPYDRIHRAVRQPGSLIKPFVYLTALEQTTGPTWPGGFGPLFPLHDTTTTFVFQGREYTPFDYDKKTRGTVPAYYALSRSLNIPAVELVAGLGPAALGETVRRFGMTTPYLDVLSSALGTNEVYPIELARAYGALANGGTLAETRILSSVLDSQGALLEHPPLRTVEAATPAATAVLVGMLQETVNHGTARAIRSAGIDVPLAGKTGTTDDGKDAWFVGFAPDLLGLVWVGFDDATPLKLTGSAAALPIWIEIAAALDLSGEEFVLPDGVETAVIDPQGAGLETPLCPADRLVTLTFVSGRLPGACAMHAPGNVTASVAAPLE